MQNVGFLMMCSYIFSGPTVLAIKEPDKSVTSTSGTIKVGKYEFLLTVKDKEDLKSTTTLAVTVKKGTMIKKRQDVYLRNRSALTVNCFVIIQCLEVSCKEDQITSAQRE